MFGHQDIDRLEEITKVRAEVEASSQMGRKHFYGPTPGITLNTVTPCAACKLLRRRCAEECPFSPYFSPHEPQKFVAVHKVFGASNVSKMLLEVPEGQRADAANSLVYEANLRLRDPVYGCMGAISALQQQVQSLQAELNAIRAEILKYKYREAASLISSNHAALVSSADAISAAIPTNSQPQGLSQPLTPPPPPKLLHTPPLKPLLSPSVILSSFSSSSTSSVYTPPKSSMSLGSISSTENVPYFV
ncbi:LOB domain-containing protein 13 isoform X2 [Vigna angularis]|uniref:LOB domain-containing protein 13 isoform X2 n=1 Tax=Phaseolus angularis TaxID=3914 RepID=UPI00080A6705|nr:LOB domain-containing protein 13 isoform X2 [Vigna angularis]